MSTVLLCSLIFLLSGLIQGLTGFGGGLARKKALLALEGRAVPQDLRGF